MTKTIRIGGASAFYGDSQIAARQLVDKGGVDYLMFDFLAEPTMAILSQVKRKRPELGYAADFVTKIMPDVIAKCAAQNIKVVTNAGGINVQACVAALQELCHKENLDLKVAGIYGDDLGDRVGEFNTEAMHDMDSGEPLPQELSTVNAYLGAAPVADALAANADIVITGRVVDSALALGPLIHEFEWGREEYDKLAQGSLVGHVIECGAQATGGTYTDWHTVPDLSDISYPIAEVSSNGEFTVSIPEGTGGLATVGSVGEQILYEIGDPANYLLPDVACDFTHVQLNSVGENKVHVSGAKGRAPGNQYKVCATWADGYRLINSAFIAGPRAADKAQAALQSWVDRTRKEFELEGWCDYRRVSFQVVGAEDTYGKHSRTRDTREVMARFALHHNERAALEFASSEFTFLATSGPPGIGAFSANGGRAKPQRLMRIHSCMVPKSKISVTIEMDGEIIKEAAYTSELSEPALSNSYANDASTADEDETKVSVPLEQLAYGRSGDKGDKANIGIMSRQPEFLPYIANQLSSERVADYFAHLISGKVTRFYLPGMNAFNFLLTEALDGGSTASLRVDQQAKTYAQMLLSIDIEIPESLLG